MKIKVLDSICGSGKSYYARHSIINGGTGKYIFITPFLNEIEETLRQCPNFVQPKNLGDGKLDNLHRILAEGKNIATTHVLFQRATQETLDLLEGYTLILDEVMTVVEQLAVSKKDLALILGSLAHVDDKGFLIWDDEDYTGTFAYIKDYCRNNSVFMVNGVALMWTFPVSIFKEFKEVYILTFMFQCQLQAYYYGLFNIEFEHLMIVKQPDNSRVVLPYKDAKYALDGNIEIYEGILNDIGDKRTSLSKQWYKNYQGTKAKVLKNNVYNYLRNVVKAKGDEIIWTTFKDFTSTIKGRGFANSFLSSNARATNDYDDRTVMAYTINKFLSPFVVDFFESKGINVDQDSYATSELVQWIFRSAIRNGNDVKIYIPSSRMRSLLQGFLSNCTK